MNAIEGLDASDIYAVDAAMIAADGTKDKSKLGANAILAVSIACCRAAATALEIPLYRFLGGVSWKSFASTDDEYCKRWVPCTFIWTGCAGIYDHAGGSTILLKKCLRWCAEVFHALASILKERGLATSVGDEGGFAPALAIR